MPLQKKTTFHFPILFLFSLVPFFSVVAADRGDSTVLSVDTVLSSRTGTASYYARKFQGRKTSSGERLDNTAYTCAHYSLPYGTYVRVTNLRNDRSVIVKVNDRFRRNGIHLVDLTWVAARDIDMLRHGIARVRVDVLEKRVGEVLMPKDTLMMTMPAPTQVPLLCLPDMDAVSEGKPFELKPTPPAVLTDADVRTKKRKGVR